ncbi:MAG: hypothetical protein DSO02_05415 [Hadesarchaea archaeon]|nr:MAG: hypothetical protein DSO02_05415 [Hadesarchaea archaeon]
MNVVWTVLGTMAIFLARLLQSILFTIKEILMVRGNRTEASLLSLAETTVWFVAFCVVMKDLLSGPFGPTAAVKATAFLLGWSVGTFLGMEVEERMARGYATVQVISVEREDELRGGLLSRGFPLTSLEAKGRSGPRTIYQIVIPRRELSKLLHFIDQVDPKAFVTILETRGVMRGVKNLPA